MTFPQGSKHPFENKIFSYSGLNIPLCLEVIQQNLSMHNQHPVQEEGASLTSNAKKRNVQSSGWSGPSSEEIAPRGYQDTAHTSKPVGDAHIIYIKSPCVVYCAATGMVSINNGLNVMTAKDKII